MTPAGGNGKKRRTRRLLLFVCTGNICRSPMAEYMLKKRLGPDSCWHVTSAGTFASYGAPASENAVKVLAERGVNLRSHLSKPLTRDLIDGAALIVVMTAAHREQLLEHVGGISEKLFTLKSFTSGGEGDVQDPIGLSIDTYRAVRDEIESALPELTGLLEEIAGEKNGNVDPGAKR